jgi:nucleotide-binding universal stress UspA family protein
MKPLSSLAVGFDGSPRSATAARQAVAIARQLGASVTLIHVGDRTDDIAAEHARLRDHGVAVSYLAVHGEVAPALVGAAAAIGADLVIVGSHGRFGAHRLLLGSVAEAVVGLATTSVLVTHSDALAGYREILVGTDFSPYALPAVARACQLAADGAGVHVVSFVGPDPAAPGTTCDDPAIAERGRSLLASHADPRLRLTFRALIGEPAEGLPAIAARDGSDLVVVGTHGYRGMRRLVLGSVSAHVVRHAPCAVLVAR